MIQREDEINGQEQPQPKKRTPKEQPDYSRQMFELYENVIWCVNQINRLYTNYPNLMNPPQQDYYSPQQQPQQPVYQEVERTPEPVNPNVPTFSKRTKHVEEEVEKLPAKPWYKQKGIIFASILGLAMIYFIYLFYMKSTGHSVTIPGIGKL
jgi:hypothetical protein